MGSMLILYRVLAKHIKICTYCCYVRCATLIVQVRESFGTKQTQLITIHSQDLKGLVVYQDLSSMGWVFGRMQGAQSGPLLWSGWLSSSSTATPHRYIHIQIHTNISWLAIQISWVFLNRIRAYSRFLVQILVKKIPCYVC